MELNNLQFMSIYTYFHIEPILQGKLLYMTHYTTDIFIGKVRINRLLWFDTLCNLKRFLHINSCLDLHNLSLSILLGLKNTVYHKGITDFFFGIEFLEEKHIRKIQENNSYILWHCSSYSQKDNLNSSVNSNHKTF